MNDICSVLDDEVNETIKSLCPLYPVSSFIRLTYSHVTTLHLEGAKQKPNGPTALVRVHSASREGSAYRNGGIRPCDLVQASFLPLPIQRLRLGAS